MTTVHLTVQICMRYNVTQLIRRKLLQTLSLQLAFMCSIQQPAVLMQQMLGCLSQSCQVIAGTRIGSKAELKGKAKCRTEGQGQKIGLKGKTKGRFKGQCQCTKCNCAGMDEGC